MAPPLRIDRLLLIALLGALVGIGLYTFGYAKGYSYLTQDPAACANCHVMQGHFDAWLKSSHRHVAACNDCHTPPNVVLKYVVKAENGFRHSLAFTTGHFPTVLRITPRDLRVTESACRGCHSEITSAIDQSAGHSADHSADRSGRGAREISCVRCHDSVGHRTTD